MAVKIKELTEKLINNEKIMSVQLSGIYSDEDKYNNELYDLINLENLIVIQDTLDKNISPEMFKNIECIFQVMTDNTELSSKRTIAFMQGFSLILDEKLEIYSSWLEGIKFKYPPKNGILNPTFRRVFTDTIKWSFNYLSKSIHLENKPTILFYRSIDCTYSLDSFIELAEKLGYNVIYIDVSKKHACFYLPLQEYEDSMEVMPLPNKKVEIVETLARAATNELNEIMNNDDGVQSYFFKPFQFINSILNTIRIKTTYDEIKIIGKTEAYLRPGFSMKGNSEITVPTLFSKVNGVPLDRDKYFSDIKELDAFRFDKDMFEITNTITVNENSSMTNENLKVEDLIDSGLWTYNSLPSGKQLTLANSIVKILNDIESINFGSQHTKGYKLEYTLQTCLLLNKDILDLFIKSDYPKKVPKIIWLSGDSIMRINHAIQLLLASYIGFDVIVFNSEGLNSIEKFINDSNYDTFWLDELVKVNYENTNLSTNKKSFLDKIFGL